MEKIKAPFDHITKRTFAAFAKRKRWRVNCFPAQVNTAYFSAARRNRPSNIWKACQHSEAAYAFLSESEICFTDRAVIGFCVESLAGIDAGELQRGLRDCLLRGFIST